MSNFPALTRPWLLALLWLLTALGAAAQNVPPVPSPPRLVNDLAGLLQPGEVQALEQKLLAYNDSTSSQMTIVTVPTLDGADIESYAQALYQKWGIGQKGKDNGVLILIANQEHKVRIQPGYGLEGTIPDAAAGRIIRSTLAPAFKQNRYYDGLSQGIDDLMALARGEYKADPADTHRGRSRDRSGSGPSVLLIVLVLVVVLFFLNRRGGGGGGRGRNRGFGGFVPPIIFGGGFGGGGGGSWGGGSSGGGGFGGFGGGSSGGGGASGSW